jgi:DNA helicase-2/ATP-dependent DNA helicase PcrA
MHDPYEPILKGLSPQQREAVTSDARATRVVACAGAGKTECMARRVLWALDRKTPPEKIVAFTFTERAARGMKGRILERAGQILGLEVRDRLGRLNVGTIHSFCFRLLRERGRLGHYDLLDEHQERAFLARHGWELGFKTLGQELLGEEIPYLRALELFRHSASAVYSELIDRDRLRRASRRFSEHLDAYERLLEDHRLLTFERVVAQAVDLLRREPAVRPDLHHLLVDEYQDVNPAQEALVVALAGKDVSVFVVGDPNQCIFEWRGSDVSCFDRFSGLFRGTKTFPLSENRRSHEEIVRAANLYGAAITPGSWAPMRALRTDRAPAVWITEYPDKEDEADRIIDKIRAEQREGRPPQDMAILLGSVDTAGAPFIDRLRAAKIPFEIGGRSGLFRHDEAQAMGRIFAWFAGHRWPMDPYDASQDLVGDGVVESALEDGLGLKGRPLDEARQTLDRLKKEALEGKHRNFVSLYQEILQALGFLRLDPDTPADAHVMAIWGRFNRLLNDYEAMIRRVSADPARGRGSRNLDWPAALDGFAWYLKGYAVSAYEEADGDSGPAGPAVRITTIHQAKGLEWPVVFLPGLLGRRFPTKERHDRNPWLLDEGLFDAARYRGDESSRRRILYVGLTRARDGLFASWFSVGHGKRSRFLDPVVSGMNPPAAAPGTPVPPDPNRRAAEKDLRIFAPTELILWRRCPYRYRLSQAWGYQAGLVPELGYGRAHHNVIGRVAERARDGARVDAKLVARELDEAFYLPYAPAGMREDMKEGARERILRYALDHKESLVRTVETEARLEFPIDGALLQGAPDVILADGNALEIRDYKTEEDDSREEESNFQVRIYAGGLGKMGRPVARANVVNLSTGRVRPVGVTAPELAAAEKKAEEAVKAILSGRFPANPGPACARCDFARICRFRGTQGHTP